MTHPEIKAVCFDMDGLLFNTEDLYDELSQEMLAQRGKKLDPNLVRRMMGLQPTPALQLFIQHYELDDTVEGLKKETDEWFRQVLPDRLDLMPGASDLLNHLQKEPAQRPLALTTSSSLDSVEQMMNIKDIRPYFQFRLTAEDVERSKPDPEIYQSAAKRFEIEPNEMLVFEDSENGCRAGVAAGAHVIAIPSKPEHDYSGSLFVAQTLEDPRIFELLA